MFVQRYKCFLKDESGASFIEYALLLTIATIMAIVVFGQINADILESGLTAINDSMKPMEDLPGLKPTH